MEVRPSTPYHGVFYMDSDEETEDVVVTHLKVPEGNGKPKKAVAISPLVDSKHYKQLEEVESYLCEMNYRIKMAKQTGNTTMMGLYIKMAETLDDSRRSLLEMIFNELKGEDDGRCKGDEAPKEEGHRAVQTSCRETGRYRLY